MVYKDINQMFYFDINLMVCIDINPMVYIDVTLIVKIYVYPMVYITTSIARFLRPVLFKPLGKT